ncbi:MAG: transglutaminase domain-containing protein [Planctomycetes bacterium]|nr:transglutaminase domain-containing protein [Planctomycetota bacterium]
MVKRLALVLVAMGWVMGWALGIAATEARGGEESTTEYLAVMLDDEKVGYMINTREVADGKVTTTTEMQMSINRAGFPMTIKQVGKSVETADGKPLAFEVVTTGMMASTIKGTIGPDGKIAVERSSGEQVAKETVDYPQGALMSEGLDLEIKRRGLKSGTSYEVMSFVPDFITAAKTAITVGEKEDVDLFGRIAQGIKVTAIMTMQAPTPMGPMDVTIPTINYVTEDNRILRSDMEVAGMKVTAYQCDKTFALSPVKSTKDFFDKSLVKLPKAVPAKAKQVTYVLKAKPGKEKDLLIPTTDAQQVAAGEDGTVRVTVTRQEPKSAQTIPYGGDNAEAQEALKPAVYVQSDDPAIVAAAKKAVAGDTNAWGAARRIADWVNKNITTKDLSVGYASASEVLKSRQGDCTEHSVLTTAMCRAVGIPARTASGMAYVDEVMGREHVLVGHQWTQVFIDGKWVDLDATVQNVSYGPRSITLMTGNGASLDFLSLLASFGLFDVTDVEISE